MQPLRSRPPTPAGSGLVAAGIALVGPILIWASSGDLTWHRVGIAVAVALVTFLAVLLATRVAVSRRRRSGIG